MSASASMPLQYKRLYKGPLDVDGTFETLELAKAYAEGPTAYGGQTIGVLVDGVRKVFVINDDGTLREQAGMDSIIDMLSWEELPEPSPVK